jgi:hypothetical protein
MSGAQVNLARQLRNGAATSGDTQVRYDRQSVVGVTTLSDAPPKGGPPATARTADASEFLELRIWAESYEDTQRARISCTNRMERGGIDPDLFRPQLESLGLAEHQIGLAMRRSYRRLIRTHFPAVEDWQKNTFGIGEHLLARLLGATGHPRLANPYTWMADPPSEHDCGGTCGTDRHLVAEPPFERSLRQWYSYCGYGDPARKRRKGMTAEDAMALGNPRAKMLLHLLAEAAMKCRPPEVSPEAIVRAAPTPLAQPENVSVAKPPPAGRFRYRRIYDEGRARYTDHDDWTAGHQHNAALRLIAKAILRDLWEIA